MKPILAVFAAAAALSAASVPAHAQTFDEIMNDLGIQKKKDQHIDYGERAPLVLPPSYEVLPPPEDSKTLVSANPQWPNDPDAARRAKEEELDRLPDQFKRKYSENPAEEIYQLNRQEKRVVQDAGSEYESSAGKGSPVLSPRELRALKKKEKVDTTVFVKEPDRKRLTDPPVGYRTPSPNQPYADNIDPKTGEPKKSFFSKLNPFNK